jgi:hypothetical protein
VGLGLDRSTSRWNAADLDARHDGRPGHPDGLGRAPIGSVKLNLGILELDRLLLVELVDKRDWLLGKTPTGTRCVQNSQVAHAVGVGGSAGSG